MRAHFVRHAWAGSRRAWTDDDRLRPLDDRGAAQALALVGQRDWSDVVAVWSSPAVRCVQTVTPLARHLGLEVVPVDFLFEGSDPTEALTAALAADGDVVCASHGDVIPDVLRLAELRGVDLGPDRRWSKGSTWTLTHDTATVTKATYTPPPPPVMQR